MDVRDIIDTMKDGSIGDEYFPQPVLLNSRGGVVMDLDAETSDDMYNDALRVVIESHKASTSILQRRLRIGYARAARIIEELEVQGVISPADGARPRDVIITNMNDVPPRRSTTTQAPAKDSAATKPISQHKTEEEKMHDLVAELDGYSEFQAFVDPYRNWIKTFFEITERKVSVLDEYGDENWDALYREIITLITKVYKQERAKGKATVLFDTDAYLIPGDIAQRFRILARGDKMLAFLGLYLEVKFKQYYATNSHNVGHRFTHMNFDALSGVEFEGYIARLLKAIGYEDVTGTAITGDQGADLIAKKDDRTIIVQVKRYHQPVGNSAIQEVVGALKFYNGDYAWVITNSTFTPGAIALAQKNNVQLTDGQHLTTLIKRADPNNKKRLIQ